MACETKEPQKSLFSSTAKNIYNKNTSEDLKREIPP